jgi:hypothetical protein
LGSAGFVGLHPHFRADGAEHLPQPRPRLVDACFHCQQRPCVAFEESDIGAVTTDRHLDRKGTGATCGAERLANERRLAVTARRDQKDFLAGEQVPGEPVELDFAIDKRRNRYNLAIDKWIVHRRLITSNDVSVT